MKADEKRDEPLFECPVCHRLVSLDHFHAHAGEPGSAIHGQVVPIPVPVKAPVPVKPSQPLKRPLARRGLKTPRERISSTAPGRLYQRFSGLADWATAAFKLHRRFDAAGMDVPPEGYAAVTVYRSLMTGVVALPLLIIVFVLSGSLLSLLLLFLPVGVFLGGMYYPSVVMSGREESVSTDLAFLATYLAMVVSAGMPVYEAIKRLAAKPNPLSSSSKEALNIQLDAEWFLKDSTLSMEHMATRHPSKAFRSWLQGILHVMSMGGDIVAHLDGAADRMLDELEVKWNDYLGIANSVGTITSLLYALLPIAIYVFLLIIINPSTITVAFAYTFLVSPAGAAAVILMSERGRPKPPESFRLYYLVAVLASPFGAVSGAVAVYGLQQPIYVGVAVMVIITCTPPALLFETHARYEGDIEGALPRLIDDIAENRRIGQDLDTTILLVAGRSRYGRALGGVVDMIAWNVRNRIRDVAAAIDLVKFRSWHNRSNFFLLQEAAESGGGTLSVFERLARFSDRYTTVRSRIKRSLTGFQALFYGISAIIIMSTLFIVQYILAPQSGLLGQLSLEGFLGSVLPSKENLMLMSSVALTGAVLNSALLGFIGGKLANGTVAGGFIHTVLSTMLALMALLFLTHVPILASLFPSAPSAG